MEEYRGVTIPTVREFLELVAPTNIVINWELKDYPRDVGDEKAFECGTLFTVLSKPFAGKCCK